MIYVFFLSFSVKAMDSITTFAEYQKEIKKFDLLLLIVLPSIIVGIGTYLYFKRNKKIK